MAGGVLFAPLQWLVAARGQLFVWTPVMIGLGVWVWFSLPFEPLLWHYGLVAVVLGGV